MTRRARTLLFLAGATVANIVLTIALFAAILALYSLTLGQFLQLRSAALPILLSFAGAVVLSTLIYKKALEKFRKKIDFDAKFGFRD